MGGSMDFELFCESLFDSVSDTLIKANLEYGSVMDKVDRLAFFSEVASWIQVTPRNVLLVLLSKHLRSIFSGVSVREEMYGRIIDAIAYMCLLAYMDVSNREESK